MINSKISL
ncbi:molybdopterin-guanine dinucleotide biosynthesis protein A, partial [Vibrio parahaemolyticus V-223/04]